MKKLFLLILITLSFRADAQLSADIAAWRAYVAANFACSTFHCRTKTIEAAEADSLYGLLLRVEAAVSAAGDLQAVTDLGNATTNDIFLGTGTTGTPNEGWFISPSGEIISGYDGLVETIGLRHTLGSTWLYLRDNGGFFGRLQSGTLSAQRTWLGPDEGDGSGLDATMVLHTTADPITVGSTSSTHVIYGSSSVQLKSSSTLNANLGENINGGYLVLRDATSGFGSILKAPTTLTSADTSYLPPLTGVIACRRDTIGDAVSDMPSLVTETYLNAWTGGGANISNQALTANADYAQQWSKQILRFDSVNHFVIRDTISNTILLNLNDVTNFATSLIYANSHSAINQIRLKCIDGFTNMVMSSGSTRSLSMAAGTMTYSMTQNATVCSLSINAGGSDANLTIDSSANAVTVNHLGGNTGAPSVAAGTGAGTTPTVTIGAGSTDLSGYINVTSGTTCAASSPIVTITFASAYGAAPKCVIISPANALTASAVASRQVYVDQATGITTTTFILTSGTTALANSSDYQWYYFVVQ